MEYTDGLPMIVLALLVSLIMNLLYSSHNIRPQHIFGLMCLFFCFVKGASAATLGYFEMKVQLPHSYVTKHLTFSEDQKYLVSASNSDKIKIWDLKTGLLIRDLGHNANRGFSLSPNGKHLLAINERDFRVLETHTGREIWSNTKYIDAGAFSQDNKRLLTLSSIQNNLWVTQFNAATGENHSSFSLTLSVRPEHFAISSAQGIGLVSGEDKKIKIVDFKSCRIRFDLSGHTERITHIALSTDGKLALSASEDKTIRIWNTQTGKLQQSFLTDTWVSSAGFSHTGKYLVAADASGMVYVWETASGRLQQSFMARNFGSIIPLQVAFHPQTPERQLFVDGPSGLQLWDIEAKSVLKNWYPPIFENQTAIFHPQMPKILSASALSLRIWDLNTGQAKNKFQGNQEQIKSAAFSTNGETLLTGEAYGGLKLWDLATEQAMHMFDFKNMLHKVLLSANQKWVFARDLEFFKIWEIETAQELFASERLEYIRDIAVSPDNRSVMILHNNELKIFNLEALQEPPETVKLGESTNRFEKLAVSPDGTKIAVSDHDNLYIVERKSLKPEKKIDFTRWQGYDYTAREIVSLAYSKDGQKLYLGFRDGYIAHWDVLKQIKVQPLNQTHYDSYIESMTLSPDNQWMLLNSYDRSLKLVDLESGKLVLSFITDIDGAYLIWTPDGYFDGSPNSSHLVHMVQGLDVFSIDQFALKYNRPDIILERLGSPETDRIKHYKQLYLRRLAKAGLTEAQLSGELHAPIAEIKSQQQTDKYLELSFELTDSKYPLKAYNIYVNDVPLFGATGKALSGQSLKATETIELNTGENKIEVSVLNNRGAESYRAMTTASYEKPVKGELYYLGFGVSDYQDTALNLKYAHKDAQDLEQALKQLPEFKQVHSQVFTNQQATAEQAKKAKAFLQQATVDDTVVLFISGHGMHDPQDNQYYFLTHETDLDRISSTAASFEDLENLLQDIKPRRKLFLMDTCESGEQAEFVSPSTQEELTQKGLQMRGFASLPNKNKPTQPNKRPEFLFEKDRFIYNDLFRRSGTVVFSSSQGGEFSYEPRVWSEKGNGFFTQAVLEGLQGKADQNADNTLLKQELFAYVRERVKALTYDKQHPTIDRDNLKQELQLKLPGSIKLVL